jgi:hypothetical protein
MESRGFSRESHLCFNLALNMMLICRQRESTVQVTRVLWYIACYGNFFLHASKYVVQQKIATVLAYLYRLVIALQMLCFYLHLTIIFDLNSM